MRLRYLMSAALLSACGAASEATLKDNATLAVKAEIETQIDVLCAAATSLQAAAPEVAWTPASHASAVTTMKTEWKKARVAYERIEGAIAVLFGELDASTDERYDGFIAEAADSDLFDGEGVTGVHAIERILWSDLQPERVVTFESSLPNYAPAAFPATAAEAKMFKSGLAERLVSDCKLMKSEFSGIALDSAAAFRGVIGSIAEQVEKVTFAATAEEESRYAQFTLGDMRANLAGGKATYIAFQAWLQSLEGGAALDARILAGFDRVDAAYDALSGDALPLVPDGFDPKEPEASALKNDAYGKLFGLLSTESDPDNAESLVSDMIAAADLMRIPELP